MVEHRVMSWWRVGLALVALSSACTKPNPKSCQDGTCTDPAFPFCDVDGALTGEAETCIAVACTANEFVACRGDRAITCNTTGTDYELELCDGGCAEELGGCDACDSHDQCPTGVCKVDGTCASETEIAFVEPSGSATSSCTRSAPCSLTHALEIPAPEPRQYILLAAGIHVAPGPYIVTGRRSLVGRGSSETTLKATNEGSVVRIEAGSDTSIERLRITEGVFAGTIGSGRGIECPLMPTGPRTLRVIDADVSNNDAEGVYADGCSVELTRSTFQSNSTGAMLINGPIRVERSTFAHNPTEGLFAAGVGDCYVANSFIVRNGNGAFMGVCDNSATFEFNTIVDNVGRGLNCNSPASAAGRVSAPNNIVARNGTNVFANGTTGCTYAGTLISIDVSALAFESPDASPYDYHLRAGSIAIDGSTASSIPVDFDGELRPRGNGRDIGADEVP